MNPADFTDILEKCLEGSASTAEQRRLADAVAANPAYGARLREAVQDDVLLRCIFRDAGAFAERVMSAVTHRGGKSRFIEEMMAQLQAERAGRETPAFRWRPWLAAAASLLLAAGIFVAVRPRPGAADGLPFPGADPIGRLTRRTGIVTVEGNRLETAANSRCRLELKDGTVVALDENTRLTARGGGADILAQERGRVYFDVRKRAQPLRVATGAGNLEILGTRVLTRGGQNEYAVVLDGHARYSFDGRRAMIGPSQVAIPWSYSVAQRQYVPGRPEGQVTDRYVAVGRVPIDPAAIGWIRDLGLDPAGICEAAWRAPTPAPPLLLDLLNYQVHGGRWSAQLADGDVVIRQDDASYGQRAMLKFQGQQWKKGLLTFRFKVLRAEGTPFSVDVGFAHPGGTDLIGVSGAIERSESIGRWMKVKLPFEIGGRDDLAIPQMEVGPEDNPGEVFRKGFIKWPGNSRIKKRDACVLALSTENCAVEFRDVRLRGTDTPLETDQVAGKPADSLLALYLFNAREGRVVRNVLDADGGLDMTIGLPDKVRWTGNSLEMLGPADITLVDKAGRLGRAWEESKGVSFEIWFSSLRQPTTQTTYLFTHLKADRYDFGWSGYPADWPCEANLFHVSHALFDDGPGRMAGRFYNNGLLSGTNAYPTMGPFLAKGSPRLVLAPTAVLHGNEMTMPPGIRIHALAIYRCPLNAAEMRASFLAGLPRDPSAGTPGTAARAPAF